VQSDLSSYIDHTLLKPDATSDQILKTCNEAIEHNFFGVCVNSLFIPQVVNQLRRSPVAAVAVIGFPLGAMSTEAKAFEASWCVKNGAKEIDMVIAIGKLKDRDVDYVRSDIRAVVQAAAPAKVKVIIETSLLNTDEKKLACTLSKEAGAHFVKTSTGFNGGGATVEDIQLMRAAVGSEMGVKASGGIKNSEQAWALIKAGATRLGTSSGISLIEGKSSQGGY